ncbi:MAG: hypothetical protein P8077_10080, partial [Gammaproteobacteria bacterium]
LARGAEMNPLSVADTMSRFEFPSADEQKSSAWLGGAVAVCLAALFPEAVKACITLDAVGPWVT